jgi:uncharacterized protein (TIGR04255 family)
MTGFASSHHSFRSPPVHETAIAVQFAELTAFRTIHFGLYYQQIAARYPVTEDQARLEPVREAFPASPRQFALTFVPRPNGPERVWYLDRPNGSLLLQLQPDRFGLNWKRVEGDPNYRRFEENGPVFLEEFRLLDEFSVHQGFGKLRPNLCEVIYVNNIFPLPGESVIECTANVLTGISLAPEAGLPSPEIIALNRVYPIDDRKGRVYAEAGIGRDSEKGDLLQLKITGRMLHQDGESIAENIQIAHDAVVNAFVALTTKDAQDKRWGYTR